MSEQDLKPCPFCGHVGLSFEDGSTYRWGLASCAACGATAGEVRRKYPPDEAWHKDAIAQWNTRSAIAQQATQATAVATWQPIETAPKDQVFLGWVSAERWSSADGEGSGHANDVSQGDFCWWRAVIGSPDGGYFENGAGQIGDSQAVTHWMPLPNPPVQHKGGA